MATQQAFAKGATYSLRGLTVTQKDSGLKASEPSVKGLHTFMNPSGNKLDVAIEDVVAVEPAGGGEYWCQIPGVDGLVRVHPNKIHGSEAAADYVFNRKGSSSNGATGATKKSDNPVEIYRAAKKEVTRLQEALEKAEMQLLEAEENMKLLAKLAAETLEADGVTVQA